MSAKSKPEHSIRLPLQLGVSSLWSLARICAAVVPGAILCIAAGTGSISIMWMVFGGYLVIYGLFQIPQSITTRPCDIVLTETGLHIEGGRHHGLYMDWSQIDPTASGPITVKRNRLAIVYLWEDLGGLLIVFLASMANEGFGIDLKSFDSVPIRQLHLQTKSGRRILLARAEAPEEQESIDAVFGSIQSRIGQAPMAESPEINASSLNCSHCRAPLPPSDAVSVTCNHCGAENSMPADIRTQVSSQKAITDNQRNISESVSNLLKQPSGLDASRTTTALFFTSLLTWGAIASVLSISSFSNLGIIELGMGLLAGVFFVLVFFTWSRAALAKRRAISLISSHFGAKMPAKGKTPCCRHCGGPLPETDNILVNCLFCEAENIIGIDLRPYAKPLKEQSLRLNQGLEDRKRDVKKWKGFSLMSIGIAVVSGLLAFAQYEIVQEFKGRLERCEQGDPEGCHKVAVSFAIGVDVAEDKEKALAYYQKACDLNHAEGCYGASFFYLIGKHVPYDEKRGNDLRHKACRLGCTDACKQ